MRLRIQKPLKFIWGPWKWDEHTQQEWENNLSGQLVFPWETLYSPDLFGQFRRLDTEEPSHYVLGKYCLLSFVDGAPERTWNKTALGWLFCPLLPIQWTITILQYCKTEGLTKSFLCLIDVVLFLALIFARVCLWRCGARNTWLHRYCGRCFLWPVCSVGD